MKNIGYALLLLVVLISCQKEQKEEKIEVDTTPIAKIKEKPTIKLFGFDIEEFNVVQDTVKPGDSFGAIMDTHGIGTAKVFEITNTVKDTFNVARIMAGKPYTVFKSKDTTEQAQVFVYQNNMIDYTLSLIHISEPTRPY